MSKPTLFCAATVKEMDACLAGIGLMFNSLPEFESLTWAKNAQMEKVEFIFAVTGVGIPLTIARLMPLVAGVSPQKIINVGIAGAYRAEPMENSKPLLIGDLVTAKSECFGDLGMEIPGEEKFLPLAATTWADDIYRNPFLLAPLAGLREGNGCTVNTCTGLEETGSRRRKIFAADFETMEGAAVALVGKFMGIPVSELRAISNFSAARDMRPENVESALVSLTNYFKTNGFDLK